MIRRLPIFTICVIALSILASRMDALAALLVYDIDAIHKGEIWRLITSHLVHFGAMHLIYNALAFGITGWIIESKGYRCFKRACLCMAFSIGVALMVFKPGMIYFGGLSGVACGAIMYGALLCLREKSPWPTASRLTIVFLLVKIILEINYNGSLLPYGGPQIFVSVPLTHLVGSITALSLFLLTRKNTLIRNDLSCEENQRQIREAEA